MDEPFSALDPMTRRSLQQEVRNLQQKLHKTIVFVTHDMEEALDLADELGSIEPGKAADVVIWESEPFKAGGRPRTVLINGKIQYQTEN